MTKCITSFPRSVVVNSQCLKIVGSGDYSKVYTSVYSNQVYLMMASLLCEKKEYSGSYLYVLPLEIWEVILSNLTTFPRTLVTASYVCKLWRHLVIRICRNFCAKHIDQRLLTEIVESAVTQTKCEPTIENDEWLRAFWLNHETSLDPCPEKEKDILRIFDKVINITASDPYLLVASYNDNKDATTIFILSSLDYAVYDEYNQEYYTDALLKKLNQPLNFDVSGKIFKTCILNLPSPVVLVVSPLGLKAFELPSRYGAGKTGTKPVMLPTDPKLKAHPKTSSEGCHILTQGPEDEDYLTLYEASLHPRATSATKRLKLDLICRFKTEASVYSWILSRGMVTTMETSGHIRSYEINRCLSPSPKRSSSGVKSMRQERMKDEDEGGRLFAESILKKDMRYPNPTLFTKDYVFSSTLVSRDLLGYWHMDRDRDYWFIGDTSSWRRDLFGPNTVITSLAPISLKQVTLGQEYGQVVTSVYYERGVLICGTKEGHVIGYRMQGTRDFSEENCFQDLTKMPWFNILGITCKSISRLGCLFTPFGLIIAVGEDTGQCPILHIPLQSTL